MPFENVNPLNHKILGYIILAIAICILLIPYVFCPQYYIPKADASMWYTAPATVEGWVLMGIGIALLLSSIVLIKIAPRNRQ
jgi:hypothetical protein